MPVNMRNGYKHRKSFIIPKKTKTKSKILNYTPLIVKNKTNFTSITLYTNPYDPNHANRPSGSS